MGAQRRERLWRTSQEEEAFELDFQRMNQNSSVLMGTALRKISGGQSVRNSQG